MKKLTLLLSATLLASSVLSGCSGSASTQTAASATESAAAETTAAQSEEPTEASESELSDGELAANVAALIDAIYVQTRTEETDEQCAAAKAAWDALTDEQKELVEGENADPDYFGRDTGDAALDDPRNQDDIGENEILVVSFGTSFNDSRAADIKGVEDALAAAYPEWSVRRAFTAQIIINHVQARDEEFIDNMDQALQRAVDNGVKNLVVQPTHLMHGAEYDEMCNAIAAYADHFDAVAIAEPLLGEGGADATVINADKQAVAEALVDASVADAGYDTLAAAAEATTAVVVVGHGTAHAAKVSSRQLASQMAALGYDNVFVGTVEGEPEETECSNIIEAVHEAGYTSVILRPLMVVAGDHANNDMAGDDEDSWKSCFTASGYFDDITCQIAGLGRIAEIQQLYTDHTAAAISTLPSDAQAPDASAAAASSLEDGVYTAEFNTDRSMFHANEECNGKGTLTVENGVMTFHVSLVSKNIVNLYVGKAADAGADPSALLEPTTDTVTYSDGLSEEVYGFDIPVAAIGEDFDLAILGAKGTWYDHIVNIANPEPIN